MPQRCNSVSTTYKKYIHYFIMFISDDWSQIRSSHFSFDSHHKVYLSPEKYIILGVLVTQRHNGQIIWRPMCLCVWLFFFFFTCRVWSTSVRISEIQIGFLKRYAHNIFCTITESKSQLTNIAILPLNRFTHLKWESGVEA